MRKVLPKEVDGGSSHLEYVFRNTCLQNAIHLPPAQPRGKAQRNPDLWSPYHKVNPWTEDCPSVSIPYCCPEGFLWTHYSPSQALPGVDGW